MKKQQKCYIYTRVSTSMQVDGYSLDAQKDKLRKYAEYQEMSIVGEYSDEGKSGKSVEGRPQFKQMLADVESGKDNVDYDSYVEKVLCYFRDRDKFSNFKKCELKNYEKFKEILIEFRTFYALEEYNLKEIDKYIWQLGKRYFPNNYGKKK